MTETRKGKPTKPPLKKAAKSKPVPKTSTQKPDQSLIDKQSDAKAFPIVGIGASAGGLAAFEAFFSGMPGDTEPGMAFVLVQHLAPDHKSLLTELVKRYTRMQVFEVEDGMKVKPNCVYIIPPNRDMALLGCTLQLLEQVESRGIRLPIDFFFRSLAQDQREQAIGIVLSGTGSDGTLGVRAIKGEGGMVMAQNPESTEYDGMPGNAINTGLVDYVLPPAEMPAQIIAYITHAFGKAPRPVIPPAAKVEDLMRKVFILLRAQTGHDFSQYKKNTISRRVERRMAVCQIGRLDEYVKYLQQTPTEVEALFRDLLIGVTNFFRDPEAFSVLREQAIPHLFSGKPDGAFIRVWVPGCSTGEEAYSIAILLQEHMEALKKSYKIQVFTTDIDSRSIDQARSGIYPASIAADVTPERLARFFSHDSDSGTFHINKSIRDTLIFSEQDVIKDPPFSKLDMISCRNLMIYMSGALQKKLIALFQYALNPGGMLFLGTSETVGEFMDRFVTIDHKSKLYQRKEDLIGARRAAIGKLFPPEMYATRSYENARVEQQFPFRELTEQALLRQYAPSGALVDAHGDILYLHGRTGQYLEPSPGEAGTNNILKMAREGLCRELTSALHLAATQKKPVRHLELRVKTNGDYSTVNLTVGPIGASGEEEGKLNLFLVIFEEAPAIILSTGPKINRQGTVEADSSKDAGDAPDERIIALNQELQIRDEYLQTTVEELKSTNEEMQSINEELHSTNEELETSKEELQSVNEELATVNAELQQKLADLSQANNDMNNLLSGTGIATIFVDHQLRILRYTPTATQIINLISSDMGRPVGHIVSNLSGYDRLVEDVKMVLDTLIPKEVEVQTKAGAWFTLRIQPYRTLENVIEGAVITFVDITERKRAEEALQKAQDDIRTLQGILPICSSCKKILDDKGLWTQVEVYVRDHSQAEFSHGICPDCMKILYPEFDPDNKGTPKKDGGTK